MLLGTLEASLLGNLLTRGKGTIRSGYRNKQEIKKKALIPPHSLTNTEIDSYYRNKPRFNGVYSRNNLPKKLKMEHIL